MVPPKIDVKQARHDVEAGDALLVCAYDSREKFESNHLEGGFPWRSFRRSKARFPSNAS